MTNGTILTAFDLEILNVFHGPAVSKTFCDNDKNDAVVAIESESAPE